ncbi:MAG: YbhB/YbcL family Raf kinase inhibitor-like protein, partial [Pseudonocardiaceae bacterium]
MALTLSSPAFADKEFIPAQYTCDGDNVSPPLSWSEVPEGAAELVLLLEDPDAPGGTHVHWSLFGIDPSCGGLEEGKLPAGAVGGKNDYGRTDW